MPGVNSPVSCFEVRVSCRDGAGGGDDLLFEALLQAGMDPVRIAEDNQNGRRTFKIYFPSLRGAQRFLAVFRSQGLKGVVASIKPLETAQWRDRWKKGIRPFPLGERFAVIPLWCRDRPRFKNRTPVYLNTVMTFGTGLHETTRLMTELIERCRGRFRRFFDIGTGTGILSIIAFHCGARYVAALDISRTAVSAARMNLAANRMKFSASRAVDFSRDRRRARFDFVAANLITDDLIGMKLKIVDAVEPSGYLAVSGISLENLARLRREFRSLPLRCLRVVRGRRWAALLYQRRPGRGETCV